MEEIPLKTREASGEMDETHSDSAHSGSDTESWIILDEEVQNEDAQGTDEVQNENYGPESVGSDGIPISEDLSEEKQGYLWNSDIKKEEDESEIEEATDAVSLLQEVKDTSTAEASNEEESECDEEDIEIIDQGVLPETIGSSILKRVSTSSDEDNLDDLLGSDDESEAIIDTDLVTAYPAEELPETYPQIKKGHTYLHKRNQSANYVLSGLLLFLGVLTIGIGLGHFLGWSEKLELQEQISYLREDKIDSLTDNLVSCMVGPEGQGLDDQDLDDKVIGELWKENQELKEELESLRRDQSLKEAMKVNKIGERILRDKLNDLMVANADLEKEVARLRYSHSAMAEASESKVTLESTKSVLIDTKETLNEVTNENDILKQTIGKMRYGGPPTTEVQISHKQKMNILQTENDELKKEVRKMRYTFPSIQVSINESSMKDDVEEAVVEDESEEIEPVQDEVLENSSNDFVENVDEYITIEDEPEEEESETVEEEAEPKSLALPMLDRISNLILNTTTTFFGQDNLDKVGFNVTRASEAVKVFKSKVTTYIESAMPEEELQQMKTVVKDLEHVMSSKWQELKEWSKQARERSKRRQGEDQDFASGSPDLDLVKKASEKMGKTLMKTLDYAKDAFGGGSDSRGGDLAAAWSHLNSKLNDKWVSIKTKYDRLVKKAEAKIKVRDDKVKVKKEKGEREVKASKSEKAPEPDRKSSHNSTWSFDRADRRSRSRKEAQRADWLFDRAGDRKKFHQFQEADWHSKRLFNKRCSDEGYESGECEDIGKLNPASVNHGSRKSRSKRHYKHSFGDRSEDPKRSSWSKKNSGRSKYGSAKHGRSEEVIMPDLFAADDLGFFHHEGPKMVIRDLERSHDMFAHHDPFFHDDIDDDDDDDVDDEDDDDDFDQHFVRHGKHFGDHHHQKKHFEQHRKHHGQGRHEHFGEHKKHFENKHHGNREHKRKHFNSRGFR